MLKARNVYWVAQAAGWLMLSLLILLSSMAAERQVATEKLVVSTVVLMITGLVVSHAMRYFIITQGWLNMRFGPLIPRILITCITAGLCMSLVTDITGILLDSTREFRLVDYFLNSITSSIFFLLWNGIYFAFHFFQKSRQQEVSNLQLSASQNEIELKNLRSQLNPHFLFNSLNSIRALIDIDPVQAKENVTTLSNLLRKSLILGREQLVPLRQELDLINDYMNLEKVRFEERIRIEMSLDDRLNELPVPPFILQTLVENAFKHGISKLIQGGTIAVSTTINDDTVTLRVQNDGTLGKTVDTGIGIRNTQRRLELQYGERASFKLEEADGKVQATIRLTQQTL